MVTPPASTPPERFEEAAAGPAAEPALAAGAQADAALQALMDAIQQVTWGEKSEELDAAVEQVRQLLILSAEQRSMQENQTALLERQLAEARSDREFLVEEQDAFLVGLLEEHEQAMAELERERDEAFERLEKLMRDTQPAPPAADARRTIAGVGDGTPSMPSVRAPRAESDRNVEKLLAERDRSREVLRRLQQQRDDAQQALQQVTRERDRYLAELSRLAPSRVGSPRQLFSPQDARRTQPAIPNATNRTTDPSPPDDESIGERMTAPPGMELAAAIALSRRSTPAGVPAQPGGLKRKPDPTTQPLGGYSLRGGDPPDSGPKGSSGNA